MYQNLKKKIRKNNGTWVVDHPKNNGTDQKK